MMPGAQKKVDSSSQEHATSPDLSAEGWQRRYDEGHTGWDRGGPNPMLLHWLQSQALTPCRLLIPGCGRGHEALQLAEEGFDVTAVDFAWSAVEHLRRELQTRGCHAEVIQSDIFEYRPKQAFDAIYEQTCLCAIEPSKWVSYETLLASWLKPGGKLFILFMQSGKDDAPPYSCELKKMRELFASTRWSWVSEPIEVPHPIGMHELACVLRRVD